MIQFYRGSYSAYLDNIQKYKEGIYFATNTGQIFHGGQSYSGLTADDKLVENITLEGGVMRITYTDGTTSTYQIDSGVYQPAIEDMNLSMPNTVGGLDKGTTVGELTGKTYNQLFDDLLFPTVYPEFINPSASIALKNYANIQEVGSTAPTSANFDCEYNPGSIVLNGVKQNNRGGESQLLNSYIHVSGNQTLPQKVAEGNTKYTYRAAYEEGPQPKDNKGNDYDSPLSSGTVDSASVTVNGTYPWYATTITAGTLTKQSLISWNATPGSMSTGGFELVPHTQELPQQFKLPRPASSIQIYNTVSGKFEDDSLLSWDVASSDEVINEVDHTYYTYSHNGSNRGSVKLIVKF